MKIISFGVFSVLLAMTILFDVGCYARIRHGEVVGVGVGAVVVHDDRWHYDHDYDEDWHRHHPWNNGHWR